MMNDGRQLGMRMIDTLDSRFRDFISNLMVGNEKRAYRLAELAKKELASSNLGVVTQNLIEEMAQAQAIKNSIINSPSIVPGLGTVFSLWLVGVEDFFLLDQGVTLILALCILNGIDIRDRQELEDVVIEIIGEVYGIIEKGSSTDAASIARDMVTRKLPRKYVNKGVNKGVHKIVHRLLPFRRRSRLLPVGFGLVMSAYHAYSTIVDVGRLTLRYIPRLKQQG